MARPKAKYNVIYADPPWAIGQNKRSLEEKHYPTMTIDEIKGMGEAIKSLTKDDGWCFLWVTNGTHRIGYEVLEEWGYTPRNTFTWCKVGGSSMGKYLRNRTEGVLVGTKGKVEPVYKNQPNFGLYPLQDHSHKPEEMFAVIERLAGEGARGLELFARRRPSANNHMKWHVWGNQVDSDISLAKFGYPVPSDVKFQTETAK